MANSINNHEHLGYDFLESIAESPTYEFMWCLRAIVWGISQFDAFEEGKEVTDE